MTGGLLGRTCSIGQEHNFEKDRQRSNHVPAACWKDKGRIVYACPSQGWLPMTAPKTVRKVKGESTNSVSEELTTGLEARIRLSKDSEGGLGSMQDSLVGHHHDPSDKIRYAAKKLVSISYR